MNYIKYMKLCKSQPTKNFKQFITKFLEEAAFIRQRIISELHRETVFVSETIMMIHLQRLWTVCSVLHLGGFCPHSCSGL